MKNTAKKLMFILFVVMIFSLTVMSSSAASDYKFTISSRSMNVGLDQFTQVKAEVEGLELQPEITWSTSDKSIATVSATGLVRGVALGEFEIIATTVVGGETLTAKFPMKVVNNEYFIASYMEKYNILSYQYCYDYCGYYYTNDKEAWQSEFGFAKVYDYMAPFVQMKYDYSRVFFTYDDQDFMVQLWKGQYVIFRGAEIGIYHRDADGLKRDPYTLYNVADKEYWVTMDMGVYHQVNEGDAPEDYELLFRRPVDQYWWCTGFVPGVPRSTDPADELRVEAALTFRDTEMATLFADELSNMGFKKADSVEAIELDGYYQDGATVNISWQNLIENDDTRDWRKIGEFLLGMLFTMFLKWGLPELMKLFVK